MPQFVLLIPPLLVDHIGGSKRCKYVTISNENGVSPEIIGIGIQNGNSSSSETVCSVVHCYWLWFYLYRSGSASPFFCIYFFLYLLHKFRDQTVGFWVSDNITRLLSMVKPPEYDKFCRSIKQILHTYLLN